MRTIKWALIVVCLSGCAAASGRLRHDGPQALRGVASEHQQVILVEALRGPYARVTTWEFNDGAWQRVFWPVRAVVGRKGVAPDGEKREGDGRTPSGIYPIGLAFGYARSFDTKLVYRQATAEDLWIDDATSPQYNRWVTRPTTAKSFEIMRRPDDLYRYGAVIEYNTDPVVPGNGSAIFLHIWRSFDHPTSGCVALSPRSLKKVLQWLDVRRDPVIVIH